LDSLEEDVVSFFLVSPFLLLAAFILLDLSISLSILSLSLSKLTFF